MDNYRVKIVQDSRLATYAIIGWRDALCGARIEKLVNF